MIIKQIKLRNFRNFENCNVYFNENLNILTGLNGQGKTNLLESIVFLSTTHSHRLNEEIKLIMHNKELSNIECIYKDDIEYNIGAIIHQKGKTLLKNKQIVSKSSDFIGLLNVILFSPSDINIFDDSPKERRKLINLEITKVNKKYLYSLNKYQKLLKERNILLKSNKIDEIYLETINEQLIENQIVILEERYKFVEIINEYISIYFKKLVNDDINLKLEYIGCVKNDDNIKENLNKMYKLSYEKDRITQNTNYGIHRDDIIFKMNDENVNDIASQGQRRLVVMALKLSLIDYIKFKINKIPVLLLDDVLSELDINKQQNLLKCINDNIQTIITTSVIHESLKKLNRNLNIQNINSGKIITKEDK